MRTLEKITIKKDFRCLKAGQVFEFREGANLLVGDQGTGKSTLLLLITRAFGNKKTFNRSALMTYDIEEMVEIVRAEKGWFFAHDFEGDNPKTVVAFGMAGMIKQELQMAAMRWSHGEFTRSLVSQIGKETGGLMVLDEPDAGLAPSSAVLLAERLNVAHSRKAQVIASVHNPIVIASVDEVFDMERLAWVSSASYLAEQWDRGVARAAEIEKILAEARAAEIAKIRAEIAKMEQAILDKEKEKAKEKAEPKKTPKKTTKKPTKKKAKKAK